MRIRREPPVQLKTPAQFDRMRAAGLVVAQALDTTVAAVRAGVSTADLDAIAEHEIRAAGAVPSFLGYHGYPATICTSVNDEIVHGIPSADRRLAAGDLISIDCGAIVDGWHGDAAVTVGVGPVGGDAARLIEACETALWHGLAEAWPGHRLTDISHAVESSARSSGPYGIVEEYVGHGIGTEMHMDPPVPNYGKPGRGPVLAEGMALAIEPMLTLGQASARLVADGWTVVTADGSWSAHFEHTVAITADGPWVLTARDGGRAGLARARASQAARVARQNGASPAARKGGTGSAARPGAARPGAARQDVARQNGASPAAREGGTGPAARPGAARPDVARQDAARQDAGRPDAGRPDAGQQDPGWPGDAGQAADPVPLPAGAQSDG